MTALDVREVRIQKFKHKVSYIQREDIIEKNKAGYTATEVTCGWAGAIFELTRQFGQEQ